MQALQAAYGAVQGAYPAAQPVYEVAMYRPMLVSLIHEFVGLHRTARFLAGICKRHTTATCSAAESLKQLRDVEAVFTKGFRVSLNNMNASKLKSMINAVLQLGATYDYILYINVLIARLHTVMHNLQAYISYYLVLRSLEKVDVLDKLDKLDTKCAADLQTEWNATHALQVDNYLLHFRDGITAMTDAVGKAAESAKAAAVAKASKVSKKASKVSKKSDPIAPKVRASKSAALLSM